ncbi:hypothetical protein MTO96_033811 [Rhipicephalus appendiculatus]
MARRPSSQDRRGAQPLQALLFPGCARTPGDAHAPETDLNPGPVGGPVPEGAPATQLDPGPGPRGAPAPDAEVDRCRSRRGDLGPGITKTGEPAIMGRPSPSRCSGKGNAVCAARV